MMVIIILVFGLTVFLSPADVGYNCTTSKPQVAKNKLPSHCTGAWCDVGGRILSGQIVCSTSAFNGASMV